MTILAEGVRVGSILFTDLVGFTAYNDAMGDAAALKVIDQQRTVVDALLYDRDDARVVKELGDGLMIWFGSAAAGLGFAIELLDAIESARMAGRFPLAVRMGLHHGEAIARGDDLVGQAVNIAARVSDLAGPGELLVSEDALSASDGSGSGVALSPIGPAAVRGVQEPIWLHRLMERRV